MMIEQRYSAALPHKKESSTKEGQGEKIVSVAYEAPVVQQWKGERPRFGRMPEVPDGTGALRLVRQGSPQEPKNFTVTPRGSK